MSEAVKALKLAKLELEDTLWDHIIDLDFDPGEQVDTKTEFLAMCDNLDRDMSYFEEQSDIVKTYRQILRGLKELEDA